MSTNTMLAEALRIAIDRIIDLLKGDDGQAFKEAERVLPHFESVLDEYVKSLAAQQNEAEILKSDILKIASAISNAGFTLVKTEHGGYQVRKFGQAVAHAAHDTEQAHPCGYTAGTCMRRGCAGGTGCQALALAAEQAQEPVLQDIEQYRMQMAGISTAALGYWKEGDSIHPDYDTLALRDVAKLYAKYDELFKHRQAAQAVPAGWRIQRNADGSIGLFAPPPKDGESRRTSECFTGRIGNDKEEIVFKLLDHMLAAASAPEAPAKDHRQWLLDKYETGPGEFWGGHP